MRIAALLLAVTLAEARQERAKAVATLPPELVAALAQKGFVPLGLSYSAVQADFDGDGKPDLAVIALPQDDELARALTAEKPTAAQAAAAQKRLRKLAEGEQGGAAFLWLGGRLVEACKKAALLSATPIDKAFGCNPRPFDLDWSVAHGAQALSCTGGFAVFDHKSGGIVQVPDGCD